MVPSTEARVDERLTSVSLVEVVQGKSEILDVYRKN